VRAHLQYIHLLVLVQVVMDLAVLLLLGMDLILLHQVAHVVRMHRLVRHLGVQDALRCIQYPIQRFLTAMLLRRCPVSETVRWRAS